VREMVKADCKALGVEYLLLHQRGDYSLGTGSLLPPAAIPGVEPYPGGRAELSHAHLD
jgi:hypothetical protein